MNDLLCYYFIWFIISYQFHYVHCLRLKGGAIWLELSYYSFRKKVRVKRRYKKRDLFVRGAFTLIFFLIMPKGERKVDVHVFIQREIVCQCCVQPSHINKNYHLQNRKECQNRCDHGSNIVCFDDNNSYLSLDHHIHDCHLIYLMLHIQF